MNEQMTKILSELAAKFGTTVEHLWAVLVRQAYVEAGTSIAASFFLLTCLIMAYRLVRRKTSRVKPPGSDYYNEPEWDEPEWDEPEWDEPEWADAGPIPWAFLIVFALFVAGFGVFAFETATTAIFNPEYWALHQIIK